MQKIAVVYHSGHGNTERFAKYVVEGAQTNTRVWVDLLKAEALKSTPDKLIAYDGFIWGAPTYLAGVSGEFKLFMDATGRLWRNQSLKGKLSSGFTVSSLPSGDKMLTLLSMFAFSMQHGMVWTGNPILPEQYEGIVYDEAINRLGSWSGMMVQASHTGTENVFTPGDIKTARLFGENFVSTLLRLQPCVEEV